MNAKKSSVCGIPCITIQGDLDHASVRELAPLMLDCLATRPGRLVFDLTGCPYLDSSGIGLFVGLLFDVAETGWIGVVGPNMPLSRVFHLTGLSSLGSFHTWADLDQLRLVLSAKTACSARPQRERSVHGRLAFS